MVRKDIEVIFWDFDGVLMNSNQIRDKGFELVLQDYPKSKVKDLLEFHRKNGGLSRYVKFTHFFENILGSDLSNDELNKWTKKFSEVMIKELVNPKLLITETISFVRQNYNNYKMHIVSGSDQDELRYLCAQLQIDDYFESIHGSPKPKIEWVRNLIKENSYDKAKCILIGDSINDWEAARVNGIQFKAYDNPVLEKRVEVQSHEKTE